jgi:adenylate cyclase
VSRGDGRLVIRKDDPLLGGTSTEAERRARRRLLRELAQAGLTREELQRAVDEDRLVLLPAEVVLTGRRRFSEEALERQAGVSHEELDAWLHASGLPHEPPMTSADLAAARALKQVLDAGLPQESLIELARVAGQGISSAARTMVRIVGDVYIRPGDTEYDLGARYAQAAAELLPRLSPLLEHQLRLHLREALRQATIGRDERATGHINASRDVAVAFADLVGFTRLGAHVEADEVGRVASRLYEIASETVRPPVQLVKMIGDAVMLVAPEPAPLVEQTLELVALVDAEGEQFPQLRAGIAHGPAVAVGADWYGHAVNLAARITGMARPGTVLTTTDVRQHARDGLSWTPALPRRIKGVTGPVFLTRVKRRSSEP